jgi:hypothetical protein
MYTGSFLEVCETGALATLQRRFFVAAIALVWIMARWRKDTREDTLSLRRTIYSGRTRAAVDVKGKF